MNSHAVSKGALRQIARSLRRGLSQSQRRIKSRRAAQILLRSSYVQRARVIAVYLSSASEMETDALIAGLKKKRKVLVVPVVSCTSERRMRMCLLSPESALRKGVYGIRQPAVPRRHGSHVDLVILPLLAFDSFGNRLGSGAGYYDRWLARQVCRPQCVGLGFALQEADSIPSEPLDYPLHAVCTERGLRRFH